MKLKHIFIFLLVSLLLANCSDDEDNNNEPTFENIVAQGTDGADIKWVFQEDGTLTVYGKGKIQNYTETKETPWRKYQYNFVKKIVIGNTITAIGDNAFSSTHITSLTIPTSVTSIGKNAFKDSYSLTELTIPESVTSIGESAFVNCASLQELTIPKSIRTIERTSFYNCYKLAKLTIPASVTTIGDLGFGGCNSLTEITLPNALTSIGASAFSDCNTVTKITIPASVTTIGKDAFSIIIPIETGTNALKTIYSYCPMNAYPTEEAVFSQSTGYILPATMHVSSADLQDYKAAQATYWNAMSITISETPAP